MSTINGKKRRPGAAATFIDERLSLGHVAFPLTDLIEETGLSATAARNQLLRLGQRRVVRVSPRHAFFVIVGPEHRVMGAPPVSWWLDDYFKYLGHPYYLTLQSAAAAHGFSPQALQVVQVMTDAPRREIIKGRLRIQFFVKHRIEQTPIQQLANTYAPLNVSTPEATAFDLVRYAPRIGGIARSVETLSPLLARMRVSELTHVLKTEHETSAAQRLGYILEKKGQTKLARAVHAWLPLQIPLIPLIATKAKPIQGPIIARWRLLNNAMEFGL